MMTLPVKHTFILSCLADAVLAVCKSILFCGRLLYSINNQFSNFGELNAIQIFMLVYEWQFISHCFEKHC